MAKSSVSKNIDMLYEISAFRYVQRTWRQFLGLDFANNAEHSFHVAWIALVIASMEGKKIDTGRMLKLALMHDICESRTGDRNYLSRQYIQKNDELAINDIFRGTVLEKEMKDLLVEMEKKESLESRIVKDADTLDIDFEIMEQLSKGNNMGKDWTRFRHAGAYKGLYTNTAKKLFKQIYKSNPHNWHMQGRNRFVAGDYKKYYKK